MTFFFLSLFYWTSCIFFSLTLNSFVLQFWFNKLQCIVCECTWSFCEMQNESKTSPGIKVIICMHTFKFKRCCRAVKIASCQADETDIFTFCCACTQDHTQCIQATHACSHADMLPKAPMAIQNWNDVVHYHKKSWILARMHWRVLGLKCRQRR